MLGIALALPGCAILRLPFQAVDALGTQIIKDTPRAQPQFDNPPGDGL